MKKIAYILAYLAIFLALTAEDWANPTLTSQYSDVLTDLKARDESVAKMDYTSSTNIPTGVIRWNSTSKKFESWDGAAWNDIWPAVATHLAATNNPHSVTTTQIGAATTANLTAHTSNTSNPHSVTTTQLGALTASNNLSDVTNSDQALNNLGAANASTVATHLARTDNPHAVTTSQIGAMVGGNNLSEITNATTARSNLTAAKSGSNSDLTQLNSVYWLQSNGNMTLEANSFLGSIFISPNASGSDNWEFSYNGSLYPPTALHQDYTTWPGWPGCTGCNRIRSIRPDIATANDCANAINTIYEDLIALGLFQ